MSIINDELYDNLANYCKEYMDIVLRIHANDANILFSDNIVQDSKKYKAKNLNNTSGKYIPETNLILINYNNFKNSWNALPITIIHELIHHADYNLFIKDYCNNVINNLYSHKFYNSFSAWSEFHARINASIHGRLLLAILDNTDYNKKDAIYDLRSKEYIMFYKSLCEDIKNPSPYDIIAYCSKLNIYNSYNEKFNINDYIPDNLIMYKNQIVNLYHCLSNMKTYNQARKLFDSLNSLIFW